MINRLRGQRVYLAGPMDFCPDRGSTWRKEITPFLHNMGIGVFDPSHKATYGFAEEDADHLSERQNLIEGIEAGEIPANILYQEYHKLMQDVVSIDLRMADEASFMILYIDLDVYSCGTFIEVATSALQRKPIVVCVKQGKIRCPPFLIGLLKPEMIFSSWDEVCKYLTHIDSSEKIDTLNRWKFFNYGKIFKNDK